MTTDREVGGPYGIRGFPTLKFFGGDKSTPDTYKGKRDLESLMSYAKQTAEEQKAKLASGEIKPKPIEEIVGARKLNQKAEAEAAPKEDSPAKKERRGKELNEGDIVAEKVKDDKPSVKKMPKELREITE